MKQFTDDELSHAYKAAGLACRQADPREVAMIERDLCVSIVRRVGSRWLGSLLLPSFMRQKARLITNAPDSIGAVRLLCPTLFEFGHGQGSQVEMAIDVELDDSLLGKGGFVALLWRSADDDSSAVHCYVDPLLGTAPGLDEVYFKCALHAWHKREVAAATEFILGFRCRAINSRVRHSLRFALGVGGDRVVMAPHDKRQAAWREVLRRLQLESCVDFERDGVRHQIPVKVARALGWRPSVLPPAPWEGVHGSIAVVDPFEVGRV